MENNIATDNCVNERNYGIDLLRIFAMLMVVILHVLGRGGVLDNVSSLSVTGEIYWAIEIACYCAVNVYGLISGYVGYRAKHKYQNIIVLCLQVTFYALIITGVEIILLLNAGEQIFFETIIFHIFPTINSLWYFSAYFCLFFFMPILNEIVKSVEKRILRNCCIFVFCFFAMVSSKVGNLNGGYSVFWLMLLYVLGGYLAKYEVLKTASVKKCFLGYFACVIITILSRIVIGNVDIKCINALVAYTSPTIVLSAVFLIVAFSKIKMNKKVVAIVSFVSPLTFSVYLIHCHPYISGKIANAFVWIAHEPIYYAPLIVLLVALAIFIACVVLDFIRINVFKVCKTKKLALLIEKFFEKVFAVIFKALRIKE